MVRPLPLTAILLLPILSRAQSLPGMWIPDTITAPCPYDSATFIRTYQGWEAYQTLDDHWNGARDSTRCIDLFEVVGNYPFPRIQLDQVDGTRPVFLRAILDSANTIPLVQNTVYTLVEYMYTGGGAAFDTTACAGGPCTSISVGVRIPDSLGTGTNLRWHTSGFSNNGFDPALELCFPTERFDQNSLRELVISLKLVAPAPGETISIQQPGLEQPFDVAQLTEASMAPYNTGQFDYDLPGFLGPSYLLMYEDSTYPAAAHQSYLDLSPIPNTGTPGMVTLTLEPYSTMVFQPFTQFRGGLVAGSDSVRHSFTFVNSGDLCMANMIVELIWGPASRYVHAGGHVDLSGARACFMFRRGSTLRVDDGVRFDYGEKHTGILGLRAGCTVDIGAGATFVLHTVVDIKEDFGATGPEDIHLTLRDGARLVFAPGARIHNGNSIGQQCRILVWLDGGSIDISGLSAEDREKVLVIELPGRDLEQPLLPGNLIAGDATLIVDARTAGSANIAVMDAAGRMAMAWRTAVVPGQNRIPFPASRLSAGTYLLNVRLNDEERTERFVLQ